MPILQYRLRHQPVQLGAVADQTVGQGALMGGAGLDLRQRRMLARGDRFQRAIRPLQIGWQQLVEVADHDQGHVVRRIPVLAHLLQLFTGQVIDLRTLRAFEAQFHGQLFAGRVAEVLTIEPALQVRVVAAVFTFDHLLGRVDSAVVEAGLGQQRQQQVKHLALVFRRGFDDESRIGITGERVPLAAQSLHAFFQAAFAAGVDTAEQQVFQQMRQLLFFALEIVQSNADHQPDRHMPVVSAGLEQQLQTVAQGIALDLETIQRE
ncbi:hypothetical protein D3C79_719110 [compost metagenome]